MATLARVEIIKSVDDILNNWNLEYLSPKFTEANINTIEKLTALTEGDIREIATNIGDRALLRKKIQELAYALTPAKESAAGNGLPIIDVDCVT